MRAEYDPWAAYYDWIHQGLPGEAEFYITRAMSARGPALELGCGTGRIAIPLAMSGGDVTGLDISRGMLAVAQEKQRLIGKCKGRFLIVQADMRQFEFNQKFATILIAYRTFMHLLTEEEQRACLASVRQHLAPRGRLIMNVWNARPTILKTVLEQGPARYRLVGTYAVPAEDLTLRHYYYAKFLEHLHVLDEHHRIQEVEVGGRVDHTSKITMRRYCFTPPKLKRLLQREGLAIEMAYGNFFGEPLVPKSTEIVLIVRRV